MSKNGYEEVKANIKGALDRCQGVGENPYFVTLIDYYGPGCKAAGGSKDWLAILPEKSIRDRENSYLRYINLDKVAYDFARKPKSITLIFNHASTAELIGYNED